MLFLITYLLSLVVSEISYSGTTLTITNEQEIKPTQVAAHKAATDLVITCTGPVSIAEKTFEGFTALTTVSIQGTDISIKANAFEGCAAITSINFNTNQLNAEKGTFSSAIMPTINYTGSSFNSASMGFIQYKIKALNIDLTGECNFGFQFSSGAHVEYININASSIHFVERCFENVTGVQLINLWAKNEITFGQSSFIDSTINEVICYAGNMISVVSHSFKDVEAIKLCNLTSDGSISLGANCFIGASIDELNLKAVQDISVNQGALQNVRNFNKVRVETNGFLSFSTSSCINSSVHTIYIKVGQYVSFNQDCFRDTPNLENLTVIANDFITFSVTSFKNSNISQANIYSNSSVSFIDGCFQNCTNLASLNIHAAGDVKFLADAFLDSQIANLYINNTNSGAVYAADPSTITFNSGSFKNCNDLKTVDINTKGSVNIQSNSFQDSKALEKLNVHANKATIQSGAFAGCDALYDPTIDANDKDVADDAFENGSGDDGKKKSSKSSSDKDDDSDQSSARTLGNVEINSIYLGTSPNIVFNLNFMAKFFRKVRKTFGHVYPSPDLVHSAIWVSNDKNVNDKSVGAIFVYGRYFNKLNSPAYLARDGAKAYVMTLKEFKEKYPSIDPMKLNTEKKMKLSDFIQKIKESGNWGVKDYNWPTNNCQHFTAKLINILGATRAAPNSDDWVELPKLVLNSLEDNEKKAN